MKGKVYRIHDTMRKVQVEGTSKKTAVEYKNVKRKVKSIQVYINKNNCCKTQLIDK